MITIYHNPRCSKSRACLQLLEERGLNFSIIDYMKQSLSAEQLRIFVDNLGIKVLVRSEEAVFKDLNLAQADESTVLQAIQKHPQLLQRPIVISGTKMLVARPPESVLELINE
ncbi:MAG: arsenate reductase (glutaredoxin) [Tatlockia sp.]|nr:arsenate reductase (glutaredoxin) [Tatlockia sp.]